MDPVIKILFLVLNAWQTLLYWMQSAAGSIADLNFIYLYIKAYILNFFSHIAWFHAMVVFITLSGLNFSLWGLIGLARLVQEKFERRTEKLSGKNGIPAHKVEGAIDARQVAVIVPAHNEELVIVKTIESLLPLVPHANIFVISDGSKDRTAAIARRHNVNVLELDPAHGKAGALLAGIDYFELDRRFEAVVFVDADTVLPKDYLKEALPYFRDSDVVAIAGYARTIWNPARQNFRQTYFIIHREIVYTLSQLLLKFGQSWKYANVATIVPGFASIYRASVLKKIDLNPPGLVIEDFNMTFEVHHKKLGKIVHHPRISGYTQDPDNLHDYFRQIKRWDLGFWQTIRHHRLWPSKFSFFLAVFVAEVLLSSLILVAAPLTLLLSLAIAAVPEYYPQIMIWQEFILQLIIFCIWIPNIIAAMIVGIIQKRPIYFIYAPFLIFLKFLDSIALILMLYKAFLVRSSGRWVSPSRRAN